MEFQPRVHVAFLVAITWACADGATTEDVASAPWRISESPPVVIGAEPREVPPYFRQVTSIAVALDGSLFVGDNGLREVVRIAADGSYIGSLGRAGEGPGEFRNPSSLWFDSGSGHLIVFDPSARRVTEFNSGGRLVRAVGTDPGLPRLGPAGQFGDGSWFVRSADQMRLAQIDGTARDTIGVFLLSRAGKVERQITSVPGTISTQLMFRGSAGIREAFYSPKPSVTALRNCLLLTPGDTPDLTVADRTGETVARFTLPIQVIPTTDEHRKLMAQRLAESAEALEDRAVLEQLANRIRMAEVLPVVYKLLVDDLGYIWTQLHDGPNGRGPDVVVLDGRGRLIGRLLLPEGGEIEAVTASALVLNTRGQFGEHLIKVFELDRRAHPGSAEIIDRCV